MNIINYFDWHQSTWKQLKNKWLILGKGPSYDKIKYVDLSNYNILTLNHTIRDQPALLSHVIDLDVIHDCKDSIISNAKFLVLPLHPHINNRPSKYNIFTLLKKDRSLLHVNKYIPILWYNLSTTEKTYGNSKIIKATYFSSEAALHLLAESGARKINSLGVDGGTQYSKKFNDLNNKTRLSNGHKSFDPQFKGISQVLRHYPLNYSPLHIDSPIKIFVGSTEKEILPFKVLEYSIKKYSSISTEVNPLFKYDRPFRQPLKPENKPRTPFSFQRFIIPEICNYKGKAIYLDSDMLLLNDITKLWCHNMKSAAISTVSKMTGKQRGAQFSTLLLQCDSINWNLDKIIDGLDCKSFTYEELMYDFAINTDIDYSLESAWNSLEVYKKGITKLLHFTNMNTQPWISCINPLGYLWFDSLIEAIQEGFIDIDFIKEEIEKGHVRPSIYKQIELGINDSLMLPNKLKKIDTTFKPPYRSSIMNSSTPAIISFYRSLAYIRHFSNKSDIKRLYRKVRRVLA